MDFMLKIYNNQLEYDVRYFQSTRFHTKQNKSCFQFIFLSSFFRESNDVPSTREVVSHYVSRLTRNLQIDSTEKRRRTYNLITSSKFNIGSEFLKCYRTNTLVRVLLRNVDIIDTVCQ